MPWIRGRRKYRIVQRAAGSRGSKTNFAWKWKRFLCKKKFFYESQFCTQLEMAKNWKIVCQGVSFISTAVYSVFHGRFPKKAGSHLKILLESVSVTTYSTFLSNISWTLFFSFGCFVFSSYVCLDWIIFNPPSIITSEQTNLNLRCTVLDHVTIMHQLRSAMRVLLAAQCTHA